MRRSKRYVGLSAAALAVSILPPFAATLWQFPVWINTSARCTFSGLALLFVLISVYPLIKLAKSYIESPSIPLVWAVILAMLLLLRSIIEQALIIAAVGLASGLIGWVLFKLRDKEKGNKEE